MKRTLFLFLILLVTLSHAQKKPLNHSVYDAWESIGTKQLSNNGQWAAFTILKQEGDARLYLNHLINNVRKEIPRAEQVQFNTSSKYALFFIKPFFKEVRQAKIKKKKADEMIKDSLGIFNLNTLALTKIPHVKSFKIPEEGIDLIAYQLEKPIDTLKKLKPAEDSKKNKTPECSELIFKNLITGVERKFKGVSEYAFSKNGKQLAIFCPGNLKDKTIPVGIFLYNTEKGTLKTLVAKKGNFKNFVFDEESEQLAFLGEHSPEKEEIKNYVIYYNSLSLDTAQVLVENNFPGMPAKWTVSGDGNLTFNKDGNHLYFGIAPAKIAKDTTLVDFEHAKLDIWGYKDDYLQPMQLKNAEKEAKKSYLTSIDIFNSDPQIVPATDLKLPEASLINEGNSKYVLASTDYGNLIAMQWSGLHQKGLSLKVSFISLKISMRKRNIL